MQVALDAARHHLLLAVVALGVGQQRRDQQRLLHHRSVHGVFRSSGAERSGQRRGGAARDGCELGGARALVGGVAAPRRAGRRARRRAEGRASTARRRSSSPQASDSTPTMNGPAARPNRFWNSASTDEPVARTPGWMTSITIAETGPTVQVGTKPPSSDQRELGAGAERDAEPCGAEGEAQHAASRRCTAAPSPRACAPGARDRRDRPPRPRRRCRARRRARPAPPSRRPAPARCRGRG